VVAGELRAVLPVPAHDAEPGAPPL